MTVYRRVAALCDAEGLGWLPGGTGYWARSRYGWTAAPVPLPGARQRLLLAMLLVNANRMVPAVRLIDELWGADLPADPRAALRTQVARLRRALGPAGRGPGHPRRGLPPRPSRAAGSTSAGSRTRWPRRRGRTANRPCACWTRPSRCAAARPWGSSRTGPFALATAARLEELRVAAAERQAGLRLSLGRVEEAVAALRALLAEHAGTGAGQRPAHAGPLPGGQAHRSPGHRRSWRRHLATELGLDPSPALQAIELDILRHTAGPPDTPRRGHDRGRCRCR